MLRTNIKRKDCRLLHSGISISKKKRRRKLFHFNLVTTVNISLVFLSILSNYFFDLKGQGRRVIVHTEWSLPVVLKHQDTWLYMITLSVHKI